MSRIIIPEHAIDLTFETRAESGLILIWLGIAALSALPATD
jgi:hypothetical protein